MSTPESQLSPKPLTIPEFASRIKAKHPQYQSLSDEELSRRVLEKYPSYRDHVDLGTVEEATAQANALEAKAKTAQTAYLDAQGRSPLGRQLNPDVVQTVKRPKLTPNEEGIVSLASDTQPVVQTAPVSLDPVIQSRLDAVKQQRQQSQIQQRVAKARQTMQRRRGPFAGLQAGVEGDVSGVNRAALGFAPPISESLSARGLQQAQQRDAIRPQIEAQVRAERQARAQQEAAVPAGIISNERIWNPERLNSEADIQKEVDLRTREAIPEIAWREQNQPEIDRLTKQYRQAIRASGAIPESGQAKWTAETIAKGGSGLAEFLAGAVKQGGRLTGKLTGNAQSTEQAANTMRVHAEALQQAAMQEGADRNQASQFVSDIAGGLLGSAPEMGLMALGVPAPLAFAVGGGTRATGQGKAVTPAALKGLATGAAFEMGSAGQGLTRIATRAGGVGVGTAGVELATGATPREAAKTGATNALISLGFNAKEIPKAALDYTVQSPFTPEPVRDALARIGKYDTWLFRSEDGRNMSIYRDPQTGGFGGVEIDAKQADKYDQAVNPGKVSKKTRQTSDLQADDYDQLARVLGVETKAPAKRLEAPDQKQPAVASEKLNETAAKPAKPEQKAPDQPVTVAPEPKVEALPVETPLPEPTKAESEVIQKVSPAAEPTKPTTVSPETSVEATSPARQVASQPIESGEGAQLPEWLSDDIARKVKESDTLGLSDNIEQLSAERLTAKEVAERIAKERNLNPIDVKELVRAVRADRGIPSMDNAAQFDAWLTSRSSTGGAVNEFFRNKEQKVTELKSGNATAQMSFDEDGSAKLFSIRVPAKQRGQGSAKALLREIANAADRHGVTVSLDASPLDRKTTTAGLVRLYEQFGFRRTSRTINPMGDPEMVRKPSPATTEPLVEPKPIQSQVNEAKNPSAQRSESAPRSADALPEVSSVQPSASEDVAPLSKPLRLEYARKIQDAAREIFDSTDYGNTGREKLQAIKVRDKKLQQSHDRLYAELEQRMKAEFPAEFEQLSNRKVASPETLTAEKSLAPNTEIKTVSQKGGNIETPAEEPQTRPSADTSAERVGTSSPTPSPAKQKLTDWGSRLKTIAESKNLDDLKALSDEMAAHKDDPKVARLRTIIQAELARARQPELSKTKDQMSATPDKKINKIEDIQGETGEKPSKTPSKAARKMLAEAERPEGKTIRPKPSHKIGVPRSNPAKNSLSEEVRALGGIKDDKDGTYRGDLERLAETGKRGTVNLTSGMDAERMAGALAERGYFPPGVEQTPNGFVVTNVGDFLDAVHDDAAGAVKHRSTEYDAIEEDPDVKAWDSLAESEYGKEVLERVQSGHAKASDIAEFVRQAKEHGLSDDAADAFIDGLHRTVQEELPRSTEKEEGYSLSEDGTLLDTDGTPLFSRVFHGSPHTFDKFDMSKVGTGEGAQAYGYGLYFTDKREIADFYRGKLVGRGASPTDIATRIYGSLPDRFNDSEKRALTIKEIRRRLEDKVAASSDLGHFDDRRIFERNMKAAIEAVEKNSFRGKTYEVELAPKDDEYLLWDKPLSEQSEKVQSALRPLLVSEKGQKEWERYRGQLHTADTKPMHWTGETVYRAVGTREANKDRTPYEIEHEYWQPRDDKATSEYLHSLGIRGIKYLDQGSRNTDNWPTFEVSRQGNKFIVTQQLPGKPATLATTEFFDTEKAAQEWLDAQPNIEPPKPTYNYVIFSDADAEIVQQPQFAREYQLGLPSESLTQQESAPKASDQRARLLVEQQARAEAADPERAAAIRKLDEIRRRGLTVDEYARQGTMFEPAPSPAEIKLLKELEKPSKRKPESAQSSMFARGEGEGTAAPSFAVESNRISLNNKAARDLFNQAYESLYQQGGRIAGAFEKAPVSLAKSVREIDAEGADELADAIVRAAKTGEGKVVIFSSERTRKHEIFHESSYAANRYLEDRHAHMATLQAGEQWMRMRAQLMRMGYPDEPATLVEEAAAHIADGSYEKLGLDRDEAIDWMDKWFTSFAKKNPNVTPATFKELSNEAEEARNKVYAAESRISERQPNQDVPSVEKGREGGDRANLARGPTDQTETPEFKRWFGDSKVVDEQGKPLVVYHATKEEFEVFDENAQQGYGFHFGTPEQASMRVAGQGKRLMPSYLSIENPRRSKDTNMSWRSQIRSAKSAGHDGIVYLNRFEGIPREAFERATNEIATKQRISPNFVDFSKLSDEQFRKYVPEARDSYIAFKPTQIKSATGNRGTFSRRDPSILMALDDDPWSRLSDLADDFERIANEPDLPEGEKPLSLPKTLDMAGLESGPTKGYTPETLAEGVEYGKQTVLEKGIDGAIEFVRNGDGIEWASTGYEVSAQLRADEARLRAEGKTEEADATQEKRLKFLDDFALAAVERGRSIVGIKAVAEFSPDRMAYMLNKVSLKKRKRGISPEEDARIAQLGEELGALEDRNKALEKALETAKSQASKRAPAKGKTKSDYQTKLDETAKSVLVTLKPKIGKFDFAGLGRSSEKGALTVGIPPLPGDAELLAQYTASQLGKFNTVSELNDHLLTEFGQDIAPYLPKIRQRAYGIRQEARLAEIEAQDTEPKRRKTILAEIQKEIADSLSAIREAQKAQEQAAKAERRAQATEMRAEARTAAKQAREAENERQKEIIKEARAELKRLREEMKQASRAETAGYRETIKAQREAARRAGLWDTPLRNEAAAARERLKTATDPKDPQTMEDLVSVGVERFLPEETGGLPRSRAVSPAVVYTELKEEFPKLVTKKNQGEIYKRAFQRLDDAKAAAREAARLRIANEESKRLWDELGADVDAQAIIIKQAEVRRKQQELRSKAVAEFDRVSRSKVVRVAHEIQAFPRSARSAIDAPLGRQGLYYLMTHPLITLKQGVPAGARGYAALHHEDYVRLQSDIAAHPDYDLAQKAGLDLTELASLTDPRLHAEEQHQSSLAEKLPHVRISEQAYIAEMNATRLGVFHVLASLGKAEGYTWENKPEFFKQAARVINIASGRGDMPEFMKKATSMSNFLFWSARLGVSRFQLANNLVNPFKYLPEKGPDTHWWSTNPLDGVPGFESYDPVVRKYQIGQLVRLGLALGALYGLSKLIGLNTDNFPVVRWRNTRYDLSNGEVGNARLVMKLAAGADAWMNGESGNEDVFADLAHYGRGKLSPVAGGVVDLYYGKDFTGTDVNAWPLVRHPELMAQQKPAGKLAMQNIILRQLLPMVAYDYADAVADSGWMGALAATPALTGVSTNTYADTGMKALKNKALAKELDRLGFDNKTILGQRTKDEELDNFIQQRIIERVEQLKVPEGTDVGKKQLLGEDLEQIKKLSKAEAAVAQPGRYVDYLKNRDGNESMSFLTDAEKAQLTEADLKQYRARYADAYVDTLKKAMASEQYGKMDDDQKVKLLNRVGRVASTLAKRQLIETKRK